MSLRPPPEAFARCRVAPVRGLGQVVMVAYIIFKIIVRHKLDESSTTAMVARRVKRGSHNPATDS